MKKLLLLLFSLMLSFSSYGEWTEIPNEVETVASKNIQIVIAPFETEGFVASEDIGEIIINNLNKSGRFSASNTYALVTNQIDFSFWK